ncbi:nudix hydrolase 8-like isoform X2 [Lycium ferocissimum]|uniref:nudix hydrolase 8-like isoform X2 n=1 Tax=Lycium ferocissimum TaxID=112874 RepID=UPI0028157EA5|nr:nudix hydrolase 8-like isoform X2 [Lycium ferocissimum]
MELKLVDSKSLFLSNLVNTEVMKSSSFLDTKLMFGLSGTHKFSSCRGVVLKASRSSASYDAASSASKENFILDEFSCQINGKSCSGLYRDVRILDASDDEYGGVLINPQTLPSNPNIFASVLCSSLSHWKMKGKKGVWLKIPVEKCDLVPIAVKVLVVQEKHSAPALSGLWKIPTGFINESEEIFTGVVREVKEETGIDTEFVEVMAFRHAHNVAFEKSDLFFVCLLRPLSTRIMVDDLEIQAAKWMPLVKFVEQPLIQADSMFRKIIDICIARLGKRYCGLSVHQLVSTFDGKLSSLYFNTVEDSDSNCQAN